MIPAIPGMGEGGGGFTGGASGPADSTGSVSNEIQTGFGGAGFNVGSYYGKGSTVSQNSPLNMWVMLGGAALVAFWLFKKKK